MERYRHGCFMILNTEKESSHMRVLATAAHVLSLQETYSELISLRMYNTLHSVSKRILIILLR
jgi:hypothetical protein